MHTLYRHKETGKLVEVSERTEAAVRIYPHEGGNAYVGTAAEFDEQFEQVPEPPFRPGMASLELVPELALPCYASSLRKNGMGAPWFDAAGVERLNVEIERHSAPGEPPSIRYEGDNVTFYDAGENQYFPCEARTEVIGGVATTLWQVGETWSWLDVVFDERAPEDQTAEIETDQEALGP